MNTVHSRAGRHESARGSHLRLATDPSSAVPSPGPTASSPWTAARPALLRLCAGEALLLHDQDVDLVDLVNRCHEIEPYLIDDDIDPDDFRLAEVLVEYLCHRYGVQRRGKGDRLTNLSSTYRRHLLPFLIELDIARPPDQRGAAALRLRPLEALPKILAGDKPLPAATVAGDLLRRRGVACVYLSREDAGRVVHGGHTALDTALAQGLVDLHTDARTGEGIIRAADLRSASLLLEREEPHGLSASTARNVLRDLKNVIARAAAHGAGVRGTFALEATEPLPSRRMRCPREPSGYIPLCNIAATAAHLPPIGQLILWLERLTGDRISEAYGPKVSDYWRDPDGQGWLRIDKQGGIASLGRDPKTGRLVSQDGKDHTKTTAGLRTIPMPGPLADLIELVIAVFHADAQTGQVDPEARLVPGIQSENTSGQSSFRTWLKAAQRHAGTSFVPHDLRAALITDLKDAGIEERVAHHYAGHEVSAPTIQDLHYDRGPDPRLLLPIARLLEDKILTEIGAETGAKGLHVPTTLEAQWGRDTRRHQQRDWIEQQLIEQGWRPAHPSEPGRGRELDVAEIAAITSKSPSRVKVLLQTGTIAGHKKRTGAREVWAAYQADVAQYLDLDKGPTLNQIATERTMGYHAVWRLARELGLVDATRSRGTRIALSAENAKRLGDELDRRVEAAAETMDLRATADLLKMEVVTVETLIRQGHLDLIDGPTDARRRYVSRSSVESYLAAHPVATGASDADSDLLLTCKTAARLAGITRPQLTTLITTRQVHTGNKPGSRHVYVLADSLRSWADRTRRPAAVRAIDAEQNSAVTGCETS